MVVTISPSKSDPIAAAAAAVETAVTASNSTTQPQATNQIKVIATVRAYDDQLSLSAQPHPKQDANRGDPDSPFFKTGESESGTGTARFLRTNDSAPKPICVLKKQLRQHPPRSLRSAALKIQRPAGSAAKAGSSVIITKSIASTFTSAISEPPKIRQIPTSALVRKGRLIFPPRETPELAQESPAKVSATGSKERGRKNTVKRKMSPMAFDLDRVKSISPASESSVVSDAESKAVHSSASIKKRVKSFSPSDSSAKFEPQGGTEEVPEKKPETEPKKCFPCPVTRAMLSMFEQAYEKTIFVEDVCKRLPYVRQERIWNVLEILETYLVVERLSKTAYRWIGWELNPENATGWIKYTQRELREEEEEIDLHIKWLRETIKLTATDSERELHLTPDDLANTLNTTGKMIVLRAPSDSCLEVPPPVFEDRQERSIRVKSSGGRIEAFSINCSIGRQVFLQTDPRRPSATSSPKRLIVIRNPRVAQLSQAESPKKPLSPGSRFRAIRLSAGESRRYPFTLSSQEGLLELYADDFS